MKICYMGNINSVHTQRWAKAFSLMGDDVHVVYMDGTEQNISALERAGVSVHLLNRKISNDLDASGHTRAAALSEKAYAVGIKLYTRLPQRLTTPLNMYLVNTRRVRSLLERIKPDILHAWFLYDSGCIAALSGYKPLIVSSLGSDVIFNVPDSDSKRPLWMLKWANRLSLQKADIITATSDYLARKTAELAPKEKTVHVVPFGVDCDTFHPEKKKDNTGALTIGFAKRLMPKYGPDTLLDAFGPLSRKYPFLKLKMAGEGYMLADLEGRAREIGVQDRVTFVGKIPHYEMPSFLSNVDIAVQPSRHDSESFGVAALEASAMEIPVVSTRVGGVPECVIEGKTGILVESNDAKALAKAISFLIDNPQERIKMGTAGREFVLQNYRWHNNVDSMMGIYQLLLSRNNTR